MWRWRGPRKVEPDELDSLITMTTPRAFLRGALIRGWTMAQAGRLTAWRVGLWSPDVEVRTTWTLREIAMMEFLLHRVGRDGLGGPDDGRS